MAWNVTQGDNQFVVAGGLAELKNMARRGDLGPGDMIQPPGAGDWMYASEIPELQPIFAQQKEEDDESGSGGMNPALLAIGGVVALAFVGIFVIGLGVSAYFGMALTDTKTDSIGEGALGYSQMIVTSAGTGLRGEPSESASITVPVAKDDHLTLLAKRGTFYKARAKSGAEGWIPLAHVIPLYQLGGAEVRDEFDPLYNPDRYVDVANASWQQLPPERGSKEPNPRTIFMIALGNKSKYPMTDLRLLATIKDAQGHEVEKFEIPIEGEIPPNEETMVGSLGTEEADISKKRDPDAPPPRILTAATFETLAETEPDLALRWTGGVEVVMKTAEFTEARIDIVELRAVPEAARK